MERLVESLAGRVMRFVEAAAQHEWPLSVGDEASAFISRTVYSFVLDPHEFGITGTALCDDSGVAAYRLDLRASFFDVAESQESFRDGVVSIDTDDAIVLVGQILEEEWQSPSYWTLSDSKHPVYKWWTLPTGVHLCLVLSETGAAHLWVTGMKTGEALVTAERLMETVDNLLHTQWRWQGYDVTALAAEHGWRALPQSADYCDVNLSAPEDRSENAEGDTVESLQMHTITHPPDLHVQRLTNNRLLFNLRNVRVDDSGMLIQALTEAYGKASEGSDAKGHCLVWEPFANCRVLLQYTREGLSLQAEPPFEKPTVFDSPQACAEEVFKVIAPMLSAGKTLQRTWFEQHVRDIGWRETGGAR